MADRDETFTRIERLWLPLYEWQNRKLLQEAQQTSQKAVDFAVEHLGATPPSLRVRLLPPSIGARESIKGFWDQNSTAYVTLPKGSSLDEQVERFIVTAHETAHPIHRQLWSATDDYKAIIKQLQAAMPEAEAAAKSFFYMDLEKLLPSGYDESDVHQIAVFGGNVAIKREIASKKDRFGVDRLSWCGTLIDGVGEVLHKPWKLEGVVESFQRLPRSVEQEVKPMIEPVLRYQRLLDRRNDLNRLDEGWCEFFAYVAARSHGIPVRFEHVRERQKVFGIGVAEYLGGLAGSTYDQGFYLLVDWARKLGGDDVTVLRENLKIGSTKELQALAK